jgi:hypothetical protein
MAFRNSGKSTLVGLFCAWLLYRDADLRILVLAADMDLAKKMVRNVKRIIERHPLMAALVPSRRADWGAERFTVERPGELRDPSMQAAGIGGNITGSRADVVICDDVEVPKTCDTANKRVDLREKLAEIAYVLTPGGTQLYIGTPHSYYSIYADDIRHETGEVAPFLAGFDRLCLPIVDESGDPAWPERFSAGKIAQIRSRTLPGKFASQMMLEMVAPEAGDLDPARIKPYDIVPEIALANGQWRMRLGDRRLVSASCHFDPSFGGRGQDGAVIAVVFVCERGEYWLQDIAWLSSDPGAGTEFGAGPRGAGPGEAEDEATGTDDAPDSGVPDPDEASILCAQAAAFVKHHHLPSVRIETNGIGRFLPGILRRALKNIGWPAAVVEQHETRNKDTRIADAFGAVLGAGLLHAAEHVWHTPLMAEMREWRIGGGGRDDGLDAVAGCLLAEPVRLPRVTRPAFRQDWRPGGVQITAPFEFAP